MSPVEKLGMMIAEEFVRQAQHQVADRILKSARKDAQTLERIVDRPKVRAAGASSGGR